MNLTGLLCLRVSYKASAEVSSIAVVNPCLNQARISVPYLIISRHPCVFEDCSYIWIYGRLPWAEEERMGHIGRDEG
jgi:hypothetical protein